MTANQKIKSLELDLNQRIRTTYAQLQTIRQNKDALQNAIDATIARSSASTKGQTAAISQER